MSEPSPSPRPGLERVGGGVLAVVAVTLVAWTLRSTLELADVAMLFLVAIAFVGARLGRAASIVASVLAVAALDFFFVPPVHTFHVEDLRHVVTFAVLLGAGVTIATLTERVRESTRDARQASSRAEIEELRSSILSAVSHDLRTPLAVVTGAASVLLEDDTGRLGDGDRRELLRSIADESARIERLIANVLEMSRLEADVALQRELVPIEEIVGSALTRLDARLSGREVRTLLPDAPWRVAVDPVLFEQVLVNLLDNAGKHTPAGSPLEVAVRADGPQLLLEVRDRGPGVPEADATRIFEKFHRGASAARGAGLGLAISRAIVRAHEGTIEVQPREGGGAIFRVTLPSFDVGTVEAEPEERA